MCIDPVLNKCVVLDKFYIKIHFLVKIMTVLTIAKYIVAAPMSIIGLLLLVFGSKFLVDVLAEKIGVSSIDITSFLILPGGFVVEGQWIWVVGLAHILIGLILLFVSWMVISVDTKIKI